MKIKALANVASEIPSAPVVVDLQNGERVSTTGFVVRDGDDNQPIIVLKAKSLISQKQKDSFIKDELSISDDQRLRPAVVAPLEQTVMSLDFRKTMWAEMKPDMYDGEQCDQVRPQWQGFAEGDMDSDYSETLELAAKHFPPGTKVLVLEPECPKCHQIPELCRGDDACDFDWDAWTADRYC